MHTEKAFLRYFKPEDQSDAGEQEEVYYLPRDQDALDKRREELAETSYVIEYVIPTGTFHHTPDKVETESEYCDRAADEAARDALGETQITES